MSHGKKLSEPPATPGHYLRNRLLPVLWRGTARCHAVVRGTFYPATLNGTRRLCLGAADLYRRHAWMQRCGSTLNKKALGLGIAMLSAKLVGNMVETRQVSNLWGLLASRPVVSETTFAVLLFVVEYVVALLVFAVIDHYVTVFQRLRAERGAAN